MACLDIPWVMKFANLWFVYYCSPFVTWISINSTVICLAFTTCAFFNACTGMGTRKLWCLNLNLPEWVQKSGRSVILPSKGKKLFEAEHHKFSHKSASNIHKQFKQECQSQLKYVWKYILWAFLCIAQETWWSPWLKVFDNATCLVEMGNRINLRTYMADQDAFTV